MNGYFGQDPLPEAYYNWNSWADPLASKIAFSSKVAIHRAITLEITERLTIEAAKAEELLPADSELMKAVFDFGNAWLESSHSLTLHDPLTAISVFYPEVCQFERGFVEVETEQEATMGGTSFISANDGNVEVSREVDADRFYQILSSTLNG